MLRLDLQVTHLFFFFLRMVVYNLNVKNKTDYPLANC